MSVGYDFASSTICSVVAHGILVVTACLVVFVFFMDVVTACLFGYENNQPHILKGKMGTKKCPHQIEVFPLYIVIEE
jgi:hypothetical protein